MPTVIQVENISKQYRLGKVGSGTIRDDFSRFLARIQGKEDPTLKIGQTNILNGTGSKDEGPDSKYIWALKDINFEVKQGEVLGIIGKNGAGKSTLLKILSKVTTPTTGSVKVNGRIASLLEVGTGFHPELSGRENIFLNGAILGMTKAEIRSKFDEIVDFSGVERYIDTPVKRYSSGMYVRLAFAVAAHLDPEILIVDEVLAVGDAEFQKKALGKMQEVSKGQGRTVLFVSHNMAAMQNLCQSCILLSNGSIEHTGETEDVINKYLSQRATKSIKLSEIKGRIGNRAILFTDGFINGKDYKDFIGIESFSDMQIELHFLENYKGKINTSRIDIGINNNKGVRVAWLSTDILRAPIDTSASKIIFKIKNIPLAPGDYTCNVYSEINGDVSDWLVDVMNFSVIVKDYYGTGKVIPSNQGYILLNYSIKL